MATKVPDVGVSFLVSQVGAHAAASFAERLAALALTPHHAGILRILGSNPGITQHALSETLGMFPSRLVLLLDALEGRKLLRRKQSSTDGRRYELYLTPAGQTTLAAIGAMTDALDDDLCAALTSDDVNALSAMLRQIVAQQKITPGVHPAFRQLGRESLVRNEDTIMSQTFKTTLVKGKTKNVVGIVVPPAILSALGTSKKPAVKVTLNGFTYQSTVATMGGKFMIGLSAENRKAAGLEGDETLLVTLALDTEPRVVEIPNDLKAALLKAKALAKFEAAAPSRRKEFVRQVQEAKAAETRERRIVKIVSSL